MGPSRSHGASTRSCRKAARNVIVLQWPCGTLAGRRSPRGAQPRSGAMLVFVQVSSMKTRRAGSTSRCRAAHWARCRATSGRSCSAAISVLWDGPPLLLCQRYAAGLTLRERSGRWRLRCLGLILARTAAASQGWTERVASSCGEATTGGRPRLLGITKRGNTYLRTLLIHGARAALPSLSASQSPMGEWLRGLIGRAHKNKVIVALAGKLARIAWAVLRSGATYVKEGRPVAA